MPNSNAHLLSIVLAFVFAGTLLAAEAPKTNRAKGKSAASSAKKPAAAPVSSVPTERVASVTALLPARPQGVGRPIADRAAWEKIGDAAFRRDVLRRAEPLLKEPLPEQPDDLYLEFSRTGNRTKWQQVAFHRRGRLVWLVLAEALENQGRFVPAIESLVAAICGEKTWVMPAHDRRLTNFNGTFVDVDLASSALAWNLATADWMLGDKLSAATRQRIRERCEHFVLAPCRAAYRGTRRLDGWMRTTNNWNAVCLAGVTGAALALLEPVEERALFVAAAEHFSKNFLAGFTPDGYCSEGLGYWDYGFGHFVMLAETVYQATAGKLDWFSQPEVAAPARFGIAIEIQKGVSPAFADCGVGARPAADIQWYVNRRLGLGLAGHDDLDLLHAAGYLFQAGLYWFPNSASRLPVPVAKPSMQLRTWFADAGVLVARPAAGSECRLGVALKGGHNAEHHNHNDVGSYAAVVGSVPVLLDPGAEVYTARTFSKDRYQSKLLNSFGHPVPVVGGQLQRPGRDAAAKVLKTEFTDDQDLLELELTSAYPCPELKRLVRTFVYSRKGAGSLSITDRVEFASPQAFGTALLTRGQWQRQEDGKLLVLDASEGVEIAISASSPVDIRDEEIREDAAVKPTRLGIDLRQPATAAEIAVVIRPLPVPNSTSSGNLLRNGGFEQGQWCWQIPEGGLGALSAEKAASGKFSLKITDHDRKLGSNITSAPIEVIGEGKFVLRGKIFTVSGHGVGLYVRCFDGQRRSLNPHDDRGNIPALGAPKGKMGAWADFAFPFTTLPGTETMYLWIHSGSSSDVEAYLDDLEIVRE